MCMWDDTWNCSWSAVWSTGLITINVMLEDHVTRRPYRPGYKPDCSKNTADRRCELVSDLLPTCSEGFVPVRVVGIRGGFRRVPELLVCLGLLPLLEEAPTAWAVHTILPVNYMDIAHYRKRQHHGVVAVYAFSLFRLLFTLDDSRDSVVKGGCAILYHNMVWCFRSNRRPPSSRIQASPTREWTEISRFPLKLPFTQSGRCSNL